MNEFDFDFDEDALTEIDAIARKIAEEEKLPATTNTERVKDLISVFEAVKCSTKGRGMKVTYDLFNTFGSVSVTGSELIFENTKLIAKAAELASNFEVYPKTDGTVQMNFAFNDIGNVIR